MELSVIIPTEHFENNINTYSEYNVVWEQYGDDEMVCDLNVSEDDYQAYMDSTLTTFEILDQYAS